MTEYAKRLEALRAELAARKLDGFLVPTSDEYLGEYVPDGAKRLQWLTGFTGSAGMAIILGDKAFLLSDSRYSIQLKTQADASLYITGDYGVKPLEEWLAENAAGKLIGYDPKLHAATFIKKLEGAGISLSPVKDNPIDTIWLDRPQAPASKIEIFSNETAGRTPAEKIALIIAAMEKEKADALVLSASDSIAWLLNIRGNDIPHIPVALSYALLHGNGSVDWFVDAARVDDKVRAHIGERVSLQPPASLPEHLGNVAGKRVWVDGKRSPLWFTQKLKDIGADIIDKKDPVIEPRACKTPAEIAAMKAAHQRDGQAVSAFLSWLDEEAPKGILTELDIEAKLKEFRGRSNLYREDSFDTIAGFAEHGAIVHYRATNETAKTIKGDGLLLIDSGGQYDDGTTDITRTIAIGTPTDEMKQRYTLVLKCHIALARALFPEGTTGAQLDAITRAPLWREGLDYGHGTGHGVGCYLSVHEEAASLSPRVHEPVKAGMILSNEPGYYKEGQYGIRLENLVLVVEKGVCPDSGKKLLGFETLSAVPFDERLIVAEMLTSAETQWLADYHAWVKSVQG